MRLLDERPTLSERRTDEKVFGLSNCFDWRPWWHRRYRPPSAPGAPAPLLHYALRGCTQLSSWPKMKSLIVIWASLITHLTWSKCFFSGKELKHSRRAGRRAAPQLSVERTRWGAPGALGRGEVNSYWQAMRTTATLHSESAFAFNHVRDRDCMAKLLMSNTIGLPLDLDLGSTETGLMCKTSHNNFTWVLTRNKHALSPCSLNSPPAPTPEKVP